MKRFVVWLVLIGCSAASAVAAVQHTLVVADFEAPGISAGEVELIHSAVVLRLATANVFSLLNGNAVKQTLDQKGLSLSAIESAETRLLVSSVVAAEYVLQGSIKRAGKGVELTLDLRYLSSGASVATISIPIPNVDSIYDTVSLAVATLVRKSLDKPDFTFSTVAEGYSIEFAANALVGSGNSGYGFSLGFTGGRGDFWAGYHTKWNFTDIPGYSGSVVLGNFGAVDFIWGNKVEGLALLTGVGGGYDFQYGVVVSPSVGVYFRNFFARYTLNFDITLGGSSSVPRTFHEIELGYSLFLGSGGKGVVEFK